MNKESRLYKIRHSAAHILAQAVIRLFGPQVKLAIGPVTEVGFFYDLLSPQSIKEADLASIETEMHKIASQNFPITGKQVSKDEARKLYNHNPFKCEIIDRIETSTVGIYSQGEFFDLCQGGHTDTTGDVQYFKLTSIAGSYWKGNKENVQLQRISGIAFETAEELANYQRQIELAKQFDHRITGKELGLFTFLPQAPGMVFFQPKGLVVYNLLQEYVRTLLKKYQYQEVKTPVLLKEELWHESGHYDNYKDNMFFCSAEDGKYCIRPMNCPCHIIMFREGLHSYRELPMRIAEFGLVHRYELSGTLHGLFRVRSFTQDDAHVFCTEESLQGEISSMLAMAKEIYDKFGFTDIAVALSTKPEKSIGEAAGWEKATQALKNALDEGGVAYTVKDGEGAFYGPKIELLINDALGRQWQCGTIQVDMVLPQRFGISYITSEQSKATPIIVHRALLGSMERFLAICLEHFCARLPFWLAPVQATILTITSKQNDYGQEVWQKLTTAGLRVNTDFSAAKIAAKIHDANAEKIPVMLILGAKEESSQTLTLRLAGGEQIAGITIEEGIAKLVKWNNQPGTEKLS